MSILTRKQSILAAAAIARRTFLPASTSTITPAAAFAPSLHSKTSSNAAPLIRPSRHFSTAETTIELPSKTGPRNGLHRHTILADDGHPLRIYSRTPSSSSSSSSNAFLSPKTERSILLLHGRTWSAQPVFDLRTSEDDEKKQSVLQSLSDLGFRAYALDLRGFGETPRDTEKSGGYTTPRRCVQDVKCAIDWITTHCSETDAPINNDAYNTYDDPTVVNTKPALLGWSQGALVAQLYAQTHASSISDLVLFGSIYDPRVIYPRKPLYDPSGKQINSSPDNKPPAPEIPNTDIAALEDFTLPGTICDEAALAFSNLALTVDPIKVAWDDLHEFNVANPALIHVPTMVVCGSQDPYVSWEAQRELYERLGSEDKVWCVLPGCDHAAHILKARKMFLRSVVGFLLRKEGF